MSFKNLKMLTEAEDIWPNRAKISQNIDTLRMLVKPLRSGRPRTEAARLKLVNAVQEVSNAFHELQRAIAEKPTN